MALKSFGSLSEEWESFSEYPAQCQYIVSICEITAWLFNKNFSTAAQIWAGLSDDNKLRKEDKNLNPSLSEAEEWPQGLWIPFWPGRSVLIWAYISDFTALSISFPEVRREGYDGYINQGQLDKEQNTEVGFRKSNKGGQQLFSAGNKRKWMQTHWLWQIAKHEVVKKLMNVFMTHWLSGHVGSCPALRDPWITLWG